MSYIVCYDGYQDGVSGPFDNIDDAIYEAKECMEIEDRHTKEEGEWIFPETSTSIMIKDNNGSVIYHTELQADTGVHFTLNLVNSECKQELSHV